jgi:hypothetical protein
MICNQKCISQFTRGEADGFSFFCRETDLTSMYDDTPVIYRFNYILQAKQNMSEPRLPGYFGLIGADTTFSLTFSCSPKKNYIEGSIDVFETSYAANGQSSRPSNKCGYYFKGFCTVKNGVFYYDASLIVAGKYYHPGFSPKPGRLLMMADSSHEYLKGEIIYIDHTKIMFHLVGITHQPKPSKAFFDNKRYFENIDFIELRSKPTS